jgi:hypothetical protein
LIPFCVSASGKKTLKKQEFIIIYQPPFSRWAAHHSLHKINFWCLAADYLFHFFIQIVFTIQRVITCSINYITVSIW